jgi:chromosome segregation ATPase
LYSAGGGARVIGVPHSLQNLRAQNRTFADTIAHQKSTIADLRATIEQLRHQRKLHLGAQLAAKIIDPDAHGRLQLDHDRLAADKRQLQARVVELERTINELRDDLAASRRAHAEDLAQHAPNTGEGAPVIPFGGGDRP